MAMSTSTHLPSPTPAAPWRAVVIGAGYAGVIAANRLRGSLTDEEAARATVTLVNPRPDFVDRIRLHELAAGTRPDVVRPLAELLHPGIELVLGAVEHLDADARTLRVRTTDGRRVDEPFDVAVYAVGSRAAALVPGAREHAFLLSDLEGAEGAARAVAAGPADQHLVVVGGGLTGVEAAAELAEQHPAATISLLSAGPIVEAMRPRARRSIGRTLRRLGVVVDTAARVERIDAEAVVLADGRRVRADACIVAASFEVPELARTSGLPTDAAGRLLVDAALRSPAAPHVLGAGDATVLPDDVGAHLRMGCAMALPLGAHAADTALAQLRGQEPEPVSLGYLLQCISLGRRAGYVQVVRADDSPRPLHVGGGLGARVKEAICVRAVRALAVEAEAPGSYWNPRGPRATRSKRSATSPTVVPDPGAPAAPDDRAAWSAPAAPTAP